MPADSKKASSSEEKFELVFVLPIDTKDQKVAQNCWSGLFNLPQFFFDRYLVELIMFFWSVVSWGKAMYQDVFFVPEFSQSSAVVVTLERAQLQKLVLLNFDTTILRIKCNCFWSAGLIFSRKLKGFVYKRGPLRKSLLRRNFSRPPREKNWKKSTKK